MAAPTIKTEEDPPAPHAAAPTAPAQLYNPYERHLSGKQLNETIDAFLRRLPPATTDVTPLCPWIYVANPLIPREARRGRGRGEEEEAPAELGAQLAEFKLGGEKRLEMLGDLQRDAREIAARKGGPTKAALTRELAVNREECVSDVLMLARLLKVRTGKWMLFVDPKFINGVWAKVARATVNNELGIAAKVGPREVGKPDGHRLVCIYTYDFADKNDVARVLVRLRQLDLVRTGPGTRQIYYKADAYTHLGIAGGNPWGLKASLYGSNEIFALGAGMVAAASASAPKRKAEDEEAGEVLQKTKVKKEEDDDAAWTF